MWEPWCTRPEAVPPADPISAGCNQLIKMRKKKTKKRKGAQKKTKTTISITWARVVKESQPSSFRGNKSKSKQIKKIKNQNGIEAIKQTKRIKIKYKRATKKKQSASTIQNTKKPSPSPMTSPSARNNPKVRIIVCRL